MIDLCILLVLIYPRLALHIHLILNKPIDIAIHLLVELLILAPLPQHLQ
jgi:hypothetical protein